MEFLKDILGEELYAQVAEKLKDKDGVKLANLAEGGYVSKEKFKAELGKVASLSEQLDERSLQLESLKESGGDMESLKQEIDRLQRENAESTKRLKVKHAVELALRGAKVKAVKAVMPYLDMESAELDGDTVVGLDEQIAKLKNDPESKFLFHEERQGVKLKGIRPGEASDDGHRESEVSHAERAYRSSPTLDNMVKLSRARINEQS